jgi:hypothetical protein
MTPNAVLHLTRKLPTCGIDFRAARTSDGGHNSSSHQQIPKAGDCV